MWGLTNFFDKFKLGARKNFIRNFFSLVVFQMVELLIPLITIPIIIYKVGIENFGLINFALVFGIFFQLIINFGFNTISIREISVNKDDILMVGKIHNDTVNAKLILSFICFIAATVIILSFNKFSTTPEIYFFTLLSLIGQSFIPTWFFQGLQESKYLAISNFIGKIFYLLLVLFLLEEEKDYIWVPVYSFISYFITFLITTYIIRQKFRIKYQFISVDSFKAQLNMGKYMFLSELKLFFISYFNIFILGIVSGNAAVAYFVGAEKYLRAISNVFVPIQNSLFPVLAVKLNSDIKEAKILIKKLLGFFFIVLLLLCIVLFLMSEWIINLFLGAEMANSVIVFQILSLIPLLSFFDTFFGKQILLNLRMEKQFFNVVLIIAIVNVPMIYLFCLNYSYIGASISQMISQLMLLTGLVWYSYIALQTENRKP